MSYVLCLLSYVLCLSFLAPFSNCKFSFLFVTGTIFSSSPLFLHSYLKFLFCKYFDFLFLCMWSRSDDIQREKSTYVLYWYCTHIQSIIDNTDSYFYFPSKLTFYLYPFTSYSHFFSYIFIFTLLLILILILTLTLTLILTLVIALNISKPPQPNLQVDPLPDFRLSKGLLLNKVSTSNSSMRYTALRWPHWTFILYGEFAFYLNFFSCTLLGLLYLVISWHALSIHVILYCVMSYQIMSYNTINIACVLDLHFTVFHLI